MSMRRFLQCGLVAALSVAAILPMSSARVSAGAQDPPVPTGERKCTLTRLASLDMTQTPSGHLTVPVSVAGTTRNFVVGLQGASAISVDLASELRLHRKDLLYGHNMITQIGGLPAFEAADVPDVQVGVVHSDSMEMYIIGDTIRGRPLPMPGGEGVSGVLGTSFLKNFDVEFDFKSNKLNLYAPTTCGGDIVFWARSYAEVPFQLNELDTVLFPMKLDGKDITGQPDLEAKPAVMGTAAVEQVFGIKKDTPGFERTPDGNYRHPFKALAVDGLAINNPVVEIHPDNPGEECRGKRYGLRLCFGGSDMRIGLTELRALHLYFSFRDKQLYITAADAHL